MVTLQILIVQLDWKTCSTPPTLTMTPQWVGSVVDLRRYFIITDHSPAVGYVICPASHPYLEPTNIPQDPSFTSASISLTYDDFHY